MTTAVRGLLLALAFLTRLPVWWLGPPRREDHAASLPAYPVVGLILGILLLALYALLQWFFPDQFVVQAALLVAAWALVTGLLHLDGLGDSADAWLGGHGDRLRSLEIMKDPRSGPAAVAVITLALVVKVAALAALLRLDAALAALLIAPVLGRAAAALLIAGTPYARKQGLAGPLAEAPATRWIGLTALGALLFVTALAGWAGLAAVLGVVAVGVWAQHLMMRRLDGFTGDTAGALVEVAELAALLGLLAVLANSAG
ncbi:adenosylcobinamide-GDP ribazoletransferase [Alkalilimnicola ehrlichii MLHE-1]|uniref:Adenosylcobinamide-GDP ribazoletransferase n=1 Tax=Alkalilimnicola ehrlichii (strain ATCC BAA-1101 / DSM 17681 / MLHE-1) TaxID=187272 RepID=COBS_ALKEH|nr:adenosylcobinamide-GDP ribazoletransferase [Alkalilimnicola ehrlichii]Q0A4T1.1 RecName: Full=Adenosylcobinamide-GDP ribazoletransferase; AltName: Full=Cobalamin synthase; AltName: Full=Cobalamin-5'-phosphate synthase [Alkalilimnicola ehrlichii MLHE-1]ABI58156.1 cobalamin-5'-phosphate synthase [Alkalilimnicola ehrlichii MLHE-1]